MADMHTLDIDSFPLSGVRLIEASAGTGKTFTIAALYLRLLLDGADDLGLDLVLRDILVVTFTEAATEELRDRLRKRLREAAACFARSEAPDGDAVLRSLIARRSDHADCAERLTEMLSRLDEAPIHTIHGFCNRTLRENAFESGALFRAEFIAEEHYLRTSLIEDFWRRRFYTAPVAYARWVRSEWRTPGDLLDSVKGYLNRHRLTAIPEPDEDDLAERERRFDALTAELPRIWQGEADGVWDALHEAVASKYLSANAKSGYKPERLAQLRPRWQRWFAAPHLPLPPGFDLLTHTGLQDNLLKAGVRAGWTPPSTGLFDVCERVHAEAHALADGRRIHVLHDALTTLRTGLRERKREEQVLSFDDLLTTLADALRGDRGDTLADAVAHRYPVALIDEFQDTDPEQYDIFQRVYAGRKGCGLFMIGDPKQAIYSFRGADIFTYMQARRATNPSGGRFTLGTNWRSVNSLVRGVDALFRRNPRRFIFDSDIGLPEVDSAGRADDAPFVIDGHTPTGLQLWFHRTGESGKPVSKGAALPSLARACAAEIERLLTLGRTGDAIIGDQPLAARHVAVLVRSHRQAEAITQALRERGIASVHHSRESVFASEEARELGMVLRAVVDAEDERHLRAAACTRLMGLTASGMHAELQAGQPWENRLEAFAGYRERWEQRGFLPMLHTLMHEQGVIARVLALPDGDRRMTNLLHIGELMQEAATEHHGVSALMRWFEEQLDDPTSLGEAAELRLESDEALVKIVTIHKSKGLQYPVVFLPFVALARGVRDDEPPLFHDDDENLMVDFGSAAEDVHRDQAYRENMAEELRLLYVALTRASHCCYLAWGRFNDVQHSGLGYLLLPPPDPDAQRPEARLADDDDGLRRVWTALQADHPGVVTVTDLDDLPAAPAGAAADFVGRPSRGRAAPLAGRVNQGWWLSSYSGLLSSHAGQLIEQPDYDALVASPDEADETPRRGDDIHGFPRGARAGTFLHQVLENSDFRNAQSVSEGVERFLPAYGFDRKWAPVVTAHLRDVLATPLDDDGLRLDGLDASRRLNELAFFFPVHDVGPADVDALLPALVDTPARPPLDFPRLRGMLKGYIDLVFEQDGRYYVVDYKSNHLGDRVSAYTPDRLRRAVAASHYDLQYMLYALAVHRYLRSRIAGYDYDRHFGGVLYLFLRGMTPSRGPATGVHRARPDREVIDRLDALFAGRNGEAA